MRLTALTRLQRFLLTHSLPRFTLVGGIGFVVDASLLAFLHYRLGLDVLPARLCSFSVALTTTWWLNRKLSFAAHASERRLAEWLRYALINGLGGALNLAIFLALTYADLGWPSQPLIALSIASACALLRVSANHNGFALVLWVLALFNRSIKMIHVQMEDYSHGDVTRLT